MPGNDMTVPYGRRLRQVVATRGRLCVGLDPHPQLLDAWGLPRDPVGLREFSLRVLGACGDYAAAFKPQVAFFEAYGAGGMAVLEQVLWEAKDTGAVVIADAKRGDIGSTLAAYADAWLAQGSPFHCDAVTLSPYLGVGALEPAFARATDANRGVYVLSATSNPEAVSVQRSAWSGAPEMTIAEHVAQQVRQRNLAVRHGADPSIGVVIGATAPQPPAVQADTGPLLIPGFGAQGGTLADVQAVMGHGQWGAVVNVSRQILRAGPTVEGLKTATIAVMRDLEKLPN